MQIDIKKHLFASILRTVAKVIEIMNDANRCKKIFFDATKNYKVYSERIGILKPTTRKLTHQ
jgi:hypothetical protein